MVVPPVRHRPRPLRTVGVVALALVAGAVGGLVAHALDSGGTGGSSSGTTSSPSSCSVTSVAARDLPSVVTISVSNGSSGGTGSGEVIRSDGYILTNNHVVASAASGGTLDVLFSDGSTAPATIVGRDPLTDLAVIKVTGVGSLPAISLGDSSTIEVGEPVVVLGAPLGLSSTVTSGIVSAVDRTVTVPGESSQNAVLLDAIQTDAAINPGNSGGAMVDCRGRLIGVPSAGATVPSASGESSGGSIGLGFAIPVDLAKTVSDEIIATGKAVHAYLGLQAEPLSVNASREHGVAEGLLVTGVDGSGPAASAGIRSGDVLSSIDGQPAISTDQLVELTLRKGAGDRVDFGVVRAGRRTTVSVVLGSR